MSTYSLKADLKTKCNVDIANIWGLTLDGKDMCPIGPLPGHEATHFTGSKVNFLIISPRDWAQRLAENKSQHRCGASAGCPKYIFP